MPTTPPETRYAKSGDIHVAYQVVGDGPMDLVVVPGYIANLDIHWDMFGFADWVDHLSSFARVILFDKRGTGLSDRNVGTSTIEERMDDLRAVLDEVGSQSAALIGFSEGGPLSMLYAATYPERVRALVLFGTFAASEPFADIPGGRDPRVAIGRLERIARSDWGKGKSLELIAPSLANHPVATKFMARLERGALSPGDAYKNLQWIYEIDVRPVARSLHVPTLVLHRTGDALVYVEGGRWLGENIPNARYVELPGDDHAPWLGDAQRFLAEAQEFLTGSRGPVETERILTTVLFTDIVRSTEHAVRLGDRAWRDLLSTHHSIVREELRNHRGLEQVTTGDGFLASFDGPARAVKCAKRIRDAVKPLGLEIRAGVHTGECERVDDTLAGIAVHTGARIMSEAQPDEVVVSATVKDLVAGSGLAFAPRGAVALKGIPGQWELFSVV